MSLEKALEANTEALLKLCELMGKQSSIYIPQVAEVKETEVKSKKTKAPEPAAIELPGKTYAEHVAESEAVYEELFEADADSKPTITAEELLKKFRIFLGHDRTAAAALLAEFGVAKFNGPDNKPAIPEARWNEFAERCNVPG